MVLFDSGTIRIKYGADFQYLDLETVDLKSVLSPNTVEPIPDIGAAVNQSLRSPADGSMALSERVRPGQTVLLVVTDHTQRWYRPNFALTPILNYLNQYGIPDSNISILVANGSLPPRPDQRRCIVGDEVQERVSIFDHDCRKDEHSYYGTTSQGVPVYINKLVTKYDHLMLINVVTYDLLAGFSGGRTNICPGISSEETIKANHNVATLTSGGLQIGPGLLSANPVHQDMMEICSLVKPTFNFSVVCNELGKNVAYFTGDWDTSWEMAYHAVQQIYAIPVHNPTDIVIASVGGYPKDETFYDSVKGLYQSMGAIKEGGTIIYLAECSQGHGNSTFFESLKLGSAQKIELSLASDFNIAKQVAFLHAQIIESHRVILVSSLSETECRQLGMTPASSLGQAISMLRDQYNQKPEVAVLPQADLTLSIPIID